MARTQAANYEQRKEAIVEAASILYAKHGFLGASLSDLAKACNTSKSLIYHYYTSKEDILFDAMDSHILELNAAADEVLSSEDEPADKLRDLARCLMKIYAGAAARHKVLLNELENLPLQRRNIIVDHQRQLVDRVEGLLRELRPEIGERGETSKPVTMLFFGMLNWTHTWYKPNKGLDPLDIADLATTLTLEGLKGFR
ncbi:MAG: TetR family transcriptional regulator [Sphingomonadales bacterium]|nr:TetR family transcriptional regulator [Sphingomonadales bacterium]